ncbi:putative membrane protein [Actinomyces sp. oral taxon 175 str. F0384]|nr:putative membrane protein [Actinomyces sp. oral taxon 175 str. F0384]
MYVLVLLVVIGMILAVVGPALATAAPTAPESETAPASQAASQAASAPASDAASSSRSSSRPAPVVVLATNNLTWADLQEQASREGAGESSGSSGVGSAADRLLAFARRGEPMNLSVRTPADRTCPADAWLTLGRGKRASAVEAAASCAGPTTAIPRSTPLVGALGQGVSIQAVGPGTQLATGAPGGSATRPAPVAPSVADALAADADLTIVDTASAASTDAERIAALDEALRTVQEQSRPGIRIIVASLADDEAPGLQMAVLPAGTRSALGTSEGLVVGDSTHQAGLVQLTDLTPTLVSALAGRRDPAFDGHALTLPKTGRTGVAAAGAAAGDARISRLADDALHARASQATVMRAGALLMGLAVALLVWAAVALRAPKASRREALRRRVTWVAVYLSGLPTALLLVNAAPWWRVGARAGSPSGWASLVAVVAAALVAAGIVGLAAGIVALVRRRKRPRSAASPSPSPSAVGAAAAAEPAGSAGASSARGEAAADPPPDEAGVPTPSTSLSPPRNRTSLTALLVAAAVPLAWLVDAAAGAPLAFNNPLGMNAVVAGRFYGVSNTAFALVAGALVVIASAWVALGGGRRMALLVTALLGGAALLVDGAPQLGADVGGALTLVPTLAFLGAGLAGLHLSWRRWLAIGAATVLVVGGFAVVDLLRPGGPTHLGRFARQVADGSATGVLGRKAYALVGPFVTKPVMAAALACVVALVAAALWWGRRQVRAWRSGKSPYAWLAPNAPGDIPRVGGQDSGPPTRGMSPSGRWVTTALKSLGVLTLVAVLVNDSGVTMAGFILAAAAPALLALTLAGSESAR